MVVCAVFSLQSIWWSIFLVCRVAEFNGSNRISNDSGRTKEESDCASIVSEISCFSSRKCLYHVVPLVMGISIGFAGEGGMLYFSKMDFQPHEKVVLVRNRCHLQKRRLRCAR